MEHTDGAAALAGIFKAVLSLEAGLIPPSRGVENLNPRIDFDKAKAKVATEVMPWPKGKLRRVSVTSAGFGGSIGHCILDHVHIVYPDYVKPGIMQKTAKRNGIAKQRPQNGNGVSGRVQTGNATASHVQGGNDTHHASTNSTLLKSSILNGHQNGHINGSAATKHHAPILSSPTRVSSATAGTRQLVLLPLSANVNASLDAKIAVLSQVVDQHSLADMAYSLAARRSRFTQRTYCIVDKDDTEKGLLEFKPHVFSSPSEVPRLGFIFTEQGAQWHAMGAKLFEYHGFRTAIEYLDYVLGTLTLAPS